MMLLLPVYPTPNLLLALSRELRGDGNNGLALLCHCFPSPLYHDTVPDVLCYAVNLLLLLYLNLAEQRPMTSPWHTSSALNSDPSRVR
jgi:hypothetical protein